MALHLVNTAAGNFMGAVGVLFPQKREFQTHSNMVPSQLGIIPGNHWDQRENPGF